jgi:hypothetical protein
MSIPTWIDADFDTRTGDVRFAIETLNTSTGKTSWSLSDTPLRTNQSHEPRLHGWCGETNNRSRYARGLVRVTKTTDPHNDHPRARVQLIRGEALSEALETLGYPELAPKEEATS